MFSYTLENAINSKDDIHTNNAINYVAERMCMLLHVYTDQLY